MEEFYYDDTSYYDELTDELKESLKKSIKKEVLDKMEKLEKENKELSDVKKNFNEIKADFERKKNEYDSKLKDLEYEMKHAKLVDLIMELCPSVKVYHVYKDWHDWKLPKCDKCDDNRRISFVSPYGKTYWDNCPYCDKVYKKFIMDEVELKEFTYKKDRYFEKFECEYRVLDKDCSSYDRGVILTASRCADNKTFDELINFMQDERKGVYFSSKEKAEEFMNWMNKDLPNNLERVN